MLLLARFLDPSWNVILIPSAPLRMTFQQSNSYPKWPFTYPCQYATLAFMYILVGPGSADIVSIQGICCLVTGSIGRNPSPPAPSNDAGYGLTNN